MIHWAWLILAFISGGSLGAILLSMFVVAKRADIVIEESLRANMNGE